MGQKIWITSDTHFNHANIINYCARPFKDVEEMNATLISKWNNSVGKEDIVWHLGDFAMGGAKEIEALRVQLNGKIYLIRGNHDTKPNDWYRERGFDRVYDKPVVVDKDVILSHEPIDVPWAFNIHGHTHSGPIRQDKYHFNVCSDVIGYVPINMNQWMKQGYLSHIESIHRTTIDFATERKRKRNLGKK